MPNLPANVGYGEVVWRVLIGTADRGDEDRYPEGDDPAGGTVRFVPSAKMLLNSTASPPVTVLLADIECAFNPDGYLVGPDGEPGVFLVATDDADLNPTGFTYEVITTIPGRVVPSFHIEVPQGTQIDLTVALPAVPSGGQPTGGTDISIVHNGDSVVVQSSTGLDAAISPADEMLAGVMLPEHVIMLNAAGGSGPEWDAVTGTDAGYSSPDLDPFMYRVNGEFVEFKGQLEIVGGPGPITAGDILATVPEATVEKSVIAFTDTRAMVVLIADGGSLWVVNTVTGLSYLSFDSARYSLGIPIPEVI